MSGAGKISKTEIGLILLAVLFLLGMTALHRTAHRTVQSGYEVTAPGKRDIEAVSVEKVNINTATTEELEALPGIGETLAGRLVEYRGKNGAFTAAEDLLEVEGIGEKTLSELREYITWEVRE